MILISLTSFLRCASAEIPDRDSDEAPKRQKYANTFSGAITSQSRAEFGKQKSGKAPKLAGGLRGEFRVGRKEDRASIEFRYYPRVSNGLESV